MPCGCSVAAREVEIGGQLLARVIAVEMPEADRPTQRLANIVRRKFARIALERDVAVPREPEPRAVRMKQIEQPVVRPVERVDAERALALGKPERHRDEEAALEGADLGDVAFDAELGLAADDVPANRRGEAPTTCRARSRSPPRCSDRRRDCRKRMPCFLVDKGWGGRENGLGRNLQQNKDICDERDNRRHCDGRNGLGSCAAAARARRDRHHAAHGPQRRKRGARREGRGGCGFDR